MATYENVGLITYKDKNGDLQRLYPITRKACIEGMDDIDAHIASTGNIHGMTAGDIGAVPTSRRINNKELSGDITLTAKDVGASTVAVDVELKRSGYAADAKKTGEVISDLGLELGRVSGSLSSLSASHQGLSNTVTGIKESIPRFAFYIATLLKDRWSGDSAPYTQEIIDYDDNITDGCRVKSYPKYSGNYDEDLVMMEACSAVSYAMHENNKVIFVCLNDKPESDIHVELEVRK